MSVHALCWRSFSDDHHEADPGACRRAVGCLALAQEQRGQGPSEAARLKAMADSYGDGALQALFGTRGTDRRVQGQGGRLLLPRPQAAGGAVNEC